MPEPQGTPRQSGLDPTTRAIAEAIGAPRGKRDEELAPEPPAAPTRRWRWGRWLALGSALLLVLGCVGLGIVFRHGVFGPRHTRENAPSAQTTGARMPASEAEARQDVIDFYRTTLQNIGEDWYWSSTAPGDNVVDREGESHNRGGQDSTFTTSFWLRGDIIDTSEQPEHADPFFDRIISVWERIGWHGTDRQTRPDGTRFYNGVTDRGLEIDLTIGAKGGIATICQTRFPKNGAEPRGADGTFPRLITRDGPAPWTPSNTR
ncbi:MAG: hypothetical protein ACRC20_13955 [Segniliparus sp.]|uniref:hypothetical protein n=1 Tax=Segniliparus sp. TaxID=2804064 RepID=UPI003F3A681D